MSWLLFAQQVPAAGPAEWGNLIVSLGTGAVAVWFAMKWVERCTEAHKAELAALNKARDEEKTGWNETRKTEKAELADILRMVLQKGKAS